MSLHSVPLIMLVKWNRVTIYPYSLRPTCLRIPVHQMDLHHCPLAVNRMLRWGVEVILQKVWQKVKSQWLVVMEEKVTWQTEQK